jgi:ribosomal protein S27AE
MLNFSDELILKAKEAKSVEDLLVLAKENNVELTEEEAQDYFTELNQKSGELSDEELDNVAGGGCDLNNHNLKPSPTNPNKWYCERCQDYSVVCKTVEYGISMYELRYICGKCGHLYFKMG